MKKIFIISLLVVTIFLLYYYFVNIDYESFNSNDMLSINQVITMGQDDIMNSVGDNTTLKEIAPFQKLMTGGEAKSNSEIQISYIRNEFGSYKNESARSLFEKTCNIGYLQILGKILNVHSENNEIINIFGARIKENMDKIYEVKKNAVLNTSQDNANISAAEQVKNTANTNMNTANINKQNTYSYYLSYSKQIYPTDKSYGAYINLMPTFGYTIDNVTQCFVDKKKTFCGTYVGTKEAKEKCLKATKYIPQNGEDKKYVEECNVEIKNWYNAYLYYYNEEQRLAKIYNDSVNAYNTAVANSKNKNFIKDSFEYWERIIKTNLVKLASTTPPFSDELSPPNNDDSVLDSTDGTPAPTKKPVSETLLAQQTNVIFQNYIYCMKDICNKIIDSNLTANNVTDVIGNNDALVGPLYLNINDIKTLSNGIETLILSLRDSGGMGGLGGGDGGNSSGFPSL